ncbi:MAG: hypothetical protein JXR70_06785 [Spirochaetales bacterium]|nr:hypothetical protein [Spirochaetales bacterium]
MVAIIIAILCIAFFVWSILPFEFPMSLQWGEYILSFLKGGGPILAALIGLVSFFIGVADIKDKIEEKKEEQEAQTEESK